MELYANSNMKTVYEQLKDIYTKSASEIRNKEKLKEFVKKNVMFHNKYSVSNTLLILSQRPDAILVAGKQQ